MYKKMSWFLLIILWAGSCFLPLNSVFASGDQVKVKSTDGIMYLSTEIENQYLATASDQPKMNLLPGGLQIPTGFAKDIGSVINSVLSFVMVIVTLLVLFYLIMGAFGWITSGGDKGKIEAARNKIVASVVGLLIVASSYAVFMLMIRFLGFASLEELFSSAQTLSGTPSTQLEQIQTATPSGE